MKNERMALLLLALLVAPRPALSQGMMEQGGLYSSVAGLGAGLAASRSHGAAVNRSYEAIYQAQQMAQAQTQAIAEKMKLGCQFEAAKQWESAEKSFKFVLQVVARRDGPGSRASIPALEHLVVVSEAQNKLDEAVNFQKTLIAFSKASRIPNVGALASQQLDLTKLLVAKDDYVAAEPVIREAMKAYEANPELPPEQHCLALSTYQQVLERLNKQPNTQPTQSVRQTNETTAPALVAKPYSAEEEASQLLQELSKRVIVRPEFLHVPTATITQSSDGLPDVTPNNPLFDPQFIMEGRAVNSVTNLPPAKE